MHMQTCSQIMETDHEEQQHIRNQDLVITYEKKLFEQIDYKNV